MIKAGSVQSSEKIITDYKKKKKKSEEDLVCSQEKWSTSRECFSSSFSHSFLTFSTTPKIAFIWQSDPLFIFALKVSGQASSKHPELPQKAVNQKKHTFRHRSNEVKWTMARLSSNFTYNLFYYTTISLSRGSIQCLLEKLHHKALLLLARSPGRCSFVPPPSLPHLSPLFLLLPTVLPPPPLS